RGGHEQGVLHLLFGFLEVVRPLLDLAGGLLALLRLLRLPGDDHVRQAAQQQAGGETGEAPGAGAEGHRRSSLVRKEFCKATEPDSGTAASPPGCHGPCYCPSKTTRGSWQNATARPEKPG